MLIKTKMLEILELTNRYLCEKCDNEEHIDIKIKVILNEQELLNLIHYDNYSYDNENNFVIVEKVFNKVNYSYFLIFNKVTNNLETYNEKISYEEQLKIHCSNNQINLSIKYT